MVKVYPQIKIWEQEPGIIGVHPNENTATVWLKTRDLITILKENNVKVYQVQI